MRHFVVQVTTYGFARIEAESWEDAESKAEELGPNDFNMTKDVDIEVISETDEDGGAI